MFNKILNSTLSISVLISFFLVLPDKAQAQGTTLKGTASQSDIIREDGPSLRREDIQNNDPFGEQTLEPAEADFDAPQQEMPKAPFDLNANQQGPMMGGQPQQAQPDAPMQQQQAMLPPQQQQIPMQAQDPESVGQMKLAWDMWHKRVAENIYLKYHTLAKMGFKRSRPLCTKVVYTVDANRNITGVNLYERSPNLMFNMMIMGVLKSMNGNPILTFPEGTRRTSVEKTGTFLWNYGTGNAFRYTTNDRETIKMNNR